MKKHYDIIVIGSGLGGLVSALILAKEGLSVCVLEKNQQYGGNLQTFSRNKHLFDTGVHYVGGLSEGQNLYRYFSFLGIMKELQIKKMDEVFDKITFDDDDNEYPQSQGAENFVRNLTKFFPEEEENLRQYCKEIHEVCAKFPRYFLVNEGSYDEHTLYRNAKEFICSITQNKKLQAVLAGNSFLYAGSEKTPLYVHALTVNSYLKSAYKFINGGSQITKLLVRELRKYNADIYKHSEVVALHKNEKGLISAAETKDGRVFSGQKFISNIELETTLKLAGSQSFKKAYLSRIQNLKPLISSFSMYLVLKPAKLPQFNYNYFHNHSDEILSNVENYTQEDWPTFYMLSAIESKKNPGFAESLSILTFMRYDEVKEWENTFSTVAQPGFRSEEYETFKSKKAQILIEKIEQKIPEIREYISHIYTSTPLSFRDYIGTKNGSIYGYEKDSENPYKTMFSPKTKIENLYLTGQTVNMHGILGCTVGAFTTCSEILGSEKINENLRGF